MSHLGRVPSFLIYLFLHLSWDIPKGRGWDQVHPLCVCVKRADAGVHPGEFCFMLSSGVRKFTKVHQVYKSTVRVVSFSSFAQKRIQGLLWKEKFPCFPYAIGSCLSGSTYHFTWRAEEEQKWDGLRQAGGVLKIKMGHRTNINHSISNMCLGISLPAVQYFLYLVIFPILGNVWGKSDIL